MSGSPNRSFDDVRQRNPYEVLEHWSRMNAELLFVPPISYQASAWIYGRHLSFFSPGNLQPRTPKLLPSPPLPLTSAEVPL